MAEEFVSEAIKPVAGTFDTAGMTRGEPGLPQRFVWRDTEYTLAAVLQAWKGLATTAAASSIFASTGSGFRPSKARR
jgi:hypothetical protein